MVEGHCLELRKQVLLLVSIEDDSRLTHVSAMICSCNRLIKIIINVTLTIFLVKNNQYSTEYILESVRRNYTN